MLESGISAEIMEEMGVWTAQTKSELEAIGFRQPGIKAPALVFPVYTWAGGNEEVYCRIRPDAPRTDSRGKARKYEQPFGQECRLYCLPSARRLIESLRCSPDSGTPKLPYLFVTEGEKKAACLVSHGLAAVGLSGVWNFKNPELIRGDWDVIGLRNLPVCIAFDSDAAQNTNVEKAESALAHMLSAGGANVFLCRLSPGPNGQKIGIDDFFAQGGNISDLHELIQPYQRPVTHQRRSNSDDLIDIALKQVQLWHDQDLNPCVTVPLQNGGQDHYKIADSRFREWLMQLAYHAQKRAAPREALERAIETLSAKARFEGEQIGTSIRIGHHDGLIWLDLCDPLRRVVKISANSWHIVDDKECPIRFLRTRSMGTLPEPIPDESRQSLKGLLSLDDQGLQIVEAFLVGCFLPPPGPFPVLVVTGEQGSGKSFGCSHIRSLIDPTVPALRIPPQTERDLIAALNSGHVLGFDNISKMPSWLSDALCSMVTGAGIATRQLHTTAEEFVVKGRRPVLINGINDVIAAPDLAERALFLDFIRPTDSERRTEHELEHEWERRKGPILSHILDRVALALKQRNTIELKELPRLADFTMWLLASVPSESQKSLQSILATNRKSKHISILEEDSVAQSLQSFLEQDGHFEGTAKQLLDELNRLEEYNAKNRPDDWPRSPESLGKRLRRLKPILEGVGMRVELRRGKQRLWFITNGFKLPSKLSNPSAKSNEHIQTPKIESDGFASSNDSLEQTGVSLRHDGSPQGQVNESAYLSGNDSSDGFDGFDGELVIDHLLIPRRELHAI